jgi:hypothetical protein
MPGSDIFAAAVNAGDGGNWRVSFRFVSMPVDSVTVFAVSGVVVVIRKV